MGWSCRRGQEGATIVARMIPSQIDPTVQSSGERRVFDLLASDADTDGWTVLHSLGLARTERHPYGEIDFVVILPGEGIVCLEVKGGGVSSTGGRWLTTDRFGKQTTLSKSPFVQARDSMFALRGFTSDHFGHGSPEANCPITCGVVFTDVACPPLTPEFERSEVIDFHDLDARPISESIRRLARARLRQHQQGRGGRRPTPSDVKALVSYLRPNFDRVPAKVVALGRSEERLLSLTEEQYDRLDELESNRRCLFEGAAGTGKTLLALEYARRAARGGKSVLFVCFNYLLGEWLRTQIEGTGITVGTWHDTLKQFILASSYADEFLAREKEHFENYNLEELFDEWYPLYGDSAIDEMTKLFDVLVVDEAQDLFNPTNLGLMDKLLERGLAEGAWAMFGDFTSQAIFDDQVTSPDELPHYFQDSVRARLLRNCRNTRRIAEEMALFGGSGTVPFRPGAEDGLPVKRMYWRTPADMVAKLDDAVARLLKDHISPNDIMVLSPRRLQNSALSVVKEIGGLPLLDCTRMANPPSNCVKFTTIHSFKGMESRVVILVDIAEVDSEWAQSLLYVGMSRARGLLVLLAHEQTRNAIDERRRTRRANAQST